MKRAADPHAEDARLLHTREICEYTAHIYAQDVLLLHTREICEYTAHMNAQDARLLHTREICRYSAHMHARRVSERCTARVSTKMERCIDSDMKP